MTNISKSKKILYFCAHPDDDTFSSAALIHALVKNNNKVICVYFKNSPNGVAKNISIEEKIQIRKTEAVDACRIVGAKPLFLNLDKSPLQFNKENVDLIVELLKKEKPNIIFIPPVNDAHPTHRTVNKIVLKATKSVKVNEKWFYETWTPLAKPNFIFFFDEDLMKIKIKAMEQHKSQLERGDFVNATVGLNTFRGLMGHELLGDFGKIYKNKEKYGEAFLVIKN
jgi:LmbE family N-acetylglucosaminyl deacetylase